MNLKLTTEIDNYKDKIEIFSQNVQKLKEKVSKCKSHIKEHSDNINKNYHELFH